MKSDNTVEWHSEKYAYTHNVQPYFWIYNKIPNDVIDGQFLSILGRFIQNIMILTTPAKINLMSHHLQILTFSTLRTLNITKFGTQLQKKLEL